MRALIQWATNPPTDYVAYDLSRATDVRKLPRKPEPVGGEVLDDQPGWYADLNVQGVTFAGFDHVALEPQGAALVVWGWNDDPTDWPVGTRSAHRWTFQLPTFDARVGQINTRQELTVYVELPADVALWSTKSTTVGPVTVLPYADFSPPAANLTIHGIWVEDGLYSQIKAARTLTGWRNWIAAG